MKINELEYNGVEVNNDAPEPKDKHLYTKELPITIGNFDVRYFYYRKRKNRDINVTVWDGDIGVVDMWLQPTVFAGLPVYQVTWVGTNPKYKGQGIGYQLYMGLIRIIGLSIVQTTSHSVGARKMWLKLAREPKIKAYGFDAPNGIVFDVAPNAKQTELRSTKRAIKLYNNDNTGMILVKANSKADKLFAALQKASAIKLKDEGPNVFGLKTFKPLVDPDRNALGWLNTKEIR